MKAHTRITFDTGEIFAANIRGRGTNDIDKKVDALIWRLESQSRGRRALEWNTKYREFVPGREFVTGNARHVKGAVYRVDLGAAIIKRFR